MGCLLLLLLLLVRVWVLLCGDRVERGEDYGGCVGFVIEDGKREVVNGDEGVRSGTLELERRVATPG